jgi:hypothetical protein
LPGKTQRFCEYSKIGAWRSLSGYGLAARKRTQAITSKGRH